MPDNIWFAGGVRVYVAPFSPTTGAEPKPADTIAYGTALGGNYALMGKTQGGPSFKPGHETRKVESDQADASIMGFRHTHTAELSLPMLDAALANIKRMLGQGLLVSGAAEISLGVGGGGPFLDYLTICLEGLAPNSTAASKLYRRLWLPKVAAGDAPEFAFKKDEETIVAGSFECYFDDAQIAGEKLWKVIDDVATP